MTKEYEDVESEFWAPEKEGDFVAGVYLSFQEHVGENDANVYNLQKEDGKIMSVWGSTVIDQKMKLLSFGDDIKIVYEGKVKPEKGREYKSFKIQKAKPI